MRPRLSFRSLIGTAFVLRIGNRSMVGLLTVGKREYRDIAAFFSGRGAPDGTVLAGTLEAYAGARALVARPSLLLADEPTGNLDTATSEQILELFRELHDDGLTLAVITHDLEVAAVAERRVQIRDGQLSELHASAT